MGTIRDGEPWTATSTVSVLPLLVSVDTKLPKRLVGRLAEWVSVLIRHICLLALRDVQYWI